MDLGKQFLSGIPVGITVVAPHLQSALASQTTSLVILPQLSQLEIKLIPEEFGLQNSPSRSATAIRASKATHLHGAKQVSTVVRAEHWSLDA